MSESTASARPATTSAPAREHTSEAPELSALGLFTVLLGGALPAIDFFIVNVALHAIDRDLQAGPALLELVIAGYGVAYAVLLVLGGRLGDTVGRRRLFLLGLAAFGLTSLACGLAPDAWTLVGARVAQGAAAALMLPQVLATIQATTRGPRKARAMGLYGAMTGLSMVAGQILGGVLVAADIAGMSWRAVFLVNVPVALLGLILAARSVPESRSAQPAAVDVPGTLLLAAALISLLLPLTEGRAAGWPVWTWVMLALFPVFVAAFGRVELRADRAGRTPLVPPSLFQSVALRRGLALIPPLLLGFSGFMFVFAVALQQGLRMGPVEAGFALVPMAVTFFLGSLAGPRLTPRFGSRVVTAGGLIQAVGIALVAGAVWRSWPGLGIADLAPGVALAGLGASLQQPTIFRIVLSGVPAHRAGVGSGVMITTVQSAVALGVAVLGSLFVALLPGAGMRDALLITLLAQLGMIALTVLLSLRLPRKAV